jgi:cellulose synthase operon protein C
MKIRISTMRILRSIIAIVIGCSIAAPTVHAEEPYEAFIQGLRERQYYDYVILYLDSIAQDPNASAEIKELVPFEKATTLQMQARSTGILNPETQAKQLEEAMAYLDQFVKNSPQHPRAGEANSRRAAILLAKARVEVWQSKSPGNKDTRTEFQNKARALVLKAREIFSTAMTQHKATWETFPAFVDRIEEPQQFAARAKAEQRYIQAQLDIAMCTYEESQSYDRTSAEFGTKMRDAAKEYEEIHSKYRSQVAGLYARTWQGKCFEEQDDIQRALGLYKELLAHPGKSAVMTNLQDQVMQFRLICLNHEQRKDYQLVIQEADSWVAAARGRKKYSQIALGIRWEQARAQLSVADDRALDEDNRNRYLSKALKTVQLIKRFPGQYKDLAIFKEREINILLKGAGAAEEPKTFDEAFGLAQEMVTKKTKAVKTAVSAAKAKGDKAEIEKASDIYLIHIDNSVNLLKTALRLADENTPVTDVNLARYYLAYMYYLGKDKHYEGAILAEFVAQNYAKDNPVQAQEAALMALALYSNAFNENQREKRKVDQTLDVTLMGDVANFLIGNWPASDRATEAKFNMGKVENILKNYETSADWYSKVPEVSAKYTEAQTNAGQAYWAAYIGASQPNAQNPGQEKLDEWKTNAEHHLRLGIDKVTKSMPPKPPAELTAAKVSLVQILVANSKYKEAIAVINDQPFSVADAIQVADESKRPAKGGVTSVEFASLVYQLLLRCYIGDQQRDKARETMKDLEKIGGADAAQMTERYKQLGEQLKQELDRLQELNQTEQLAAVRSSFEAFLKDMSEREEQSAGSLTWIGETYFGLAQSSSQDAAAAGEYFNSASTAYQMIIDRAKDDVEFMPAKQITTVKLRLVNCRRFQGKYEEAETLVKQVAKAKPNNLDVQFEAALNYQTWAESGETDKYLIAIKGGGDLWGWGKTASMLQRQLAAGRSQYLDQHFEARLHIVECRYKYATAQSATAQREAQMAMAERELITFVRITRDFPDTWWPQFDNLYKDIQRGQGITVPIDLERPLDFTPAPDVKVADTGSDSNGATKKKKNKTAAKPKEKTDSTLTYILFGVVGLAGLGGMFWMVTKSKTRPLTPAMAHAAENPPVIAPPPAAPRKKRPAGSRPQNAPTTGGPPAAKPKRPLTPEEKEQLARKKAARAKAQQQQRKKKPE